MRTIGLKIQRFFASRFSAKALAGHLVVAGIVFPMLLAEARAHITLDGFHVFSRSCGPGWAIGVRETITWSPAFHRDWFWTVSHHYVLRNDGRYYYLHSINTYDKSPSTGGWEYTWRSYAGHNESAVHYVQGDHYRMVNRQAVVFWKSDAHDCNPGEL